MTTHDAHTDSVAAADDDPKVATYLRLRAAERERMAARSAALAADPAASARLRKDSEALARTATEVSDIAVRMHGADRARLFEAAGVMQQTAQALLAAHGEDSRS